MRGSTGKMQSLLFPCHFMSLCTVTRQCDPVVACFVSITNNLVKKINKNCLKACMLVDCKRSQTTNAVKSSQALINKISTREIKRLSWIVA